MCYNNTVPETAWKAKFITFLIQIPPSNLAQVFMFAGQVFVNSARLHCVIFLQAVGAHLLHGGGYEAVGVGVLGDAEVRHAQGDVVTISDTFPLLVVKPGHCRV